jgi:uncharacterized membrane protein
MLVLVPPLSTPDQGLHFARAYQVSEGGWLPLKRNGESGGFLPISLLGLTQSFGSISQHGESKISNPVETYRNLFQARLEPATRRFVPFPWTAAESPLPYVPQAIGIRIATLISDSALVCVYGARIANLLFALAFVAAAIRITPVYKWVFAVFALTPQILSEMASTSGFALTYAAAFLFIALVLRLAFGARPVAGKVWAALFVAAAALGLVIQGYWTLVLLFLLVPSDCLGNRRRYWPVFAGLVLVVAGAATAWHVLRAPTFSPLVAGSDPAAQIRLLVHEPRRIPSVVGYTLDKPLLHLASLYAGVIVTTAISVPLLFVPVYAALVCGIALFDRTPGVRRMGIGRRVLALAVGVLGVIVLRMVFYVTWMPVGESHVRYFDPNMLTPFAFVILLGLGNLWPGEGRVAGFIRSHLGAFIVVYILIRYGESAWLLLGRYYGRGA